MNDPDLTRRPCIHCGNIWRSQASSDLGPLCHTDWKEGEPLEVQDDCYRLVTVYHEEIGFRRAKELPNGGLFDLLDSLGVRDVESFAVFLKGVLEQKAALDQTPEAEPRRHTMFDKAGQEIDSEEHMRLSSDRAYAQIEDARVESPSLKAGVRVSTVWTGLSTTSYGPLDIFETRIFSDFEGADPDHNRCWRYSTEDEAKVGHRLAIERMVGVIPRAVVTPRTA